LTQSNPPTGGQTTSDSYHILNYQNEPYSIESIIHFSKSTKTPRPRRGKKWNHILGQLLCHTNTRTI